MEGDGLWVLGLLTMVKDRGQPRVAAALRWRMKGYGCSVDFFQCLGFVFLGFWLEFLGFFFLGLGGISGLWLEQDEQKQFDSIRKRKKKFVKNFRDAFGGFFFLGLFV